MAVNVIERQPVTVIGLRHIGPFDASIPQFWREMFYPWAAAHHLLDYPRYGISYDNPNVTPPEQCRYDACVEVPSDFVGPGDVIKTTIPGGQYASLDFRGTGQAIGEAWAALFGEWLPTSGFRLDARPCFEYYPKDARLDAKTGAFECQLYIPVAAQQGSA